MPTGFDRGGFGGGTGASRPTQPRSSEPSFPPPDDLPPPDDHRILETTTRPVLIATVWTRWVTASDERTCPECAPLEGAIWPENEGPQPPLHGNCRCTRAVAFIEVSSR